MPEESGYISRLWNHWWSLVIGVAAGVMWAVESIAKYRGIDWNWPSWVFPAVFVSGVVLAQFLAFRDMRKERDGAMALLDRLSAPRYPDLVAVPSAVQLTGYDTLPDPMTHS